MKDTVCSAGFAVLRTPLLSADAAVEQAAPDELDARIQRVLAFATTMPVRTALAVAAPSLLRALSATPVRRSAVLSLMRYLERMRGRATPFALCAGYAWLAVDDVRSEQSEPSSVRLVGVEDYRAALRIDVSSITAALRKQLTEQPLLATRLRWAPNREIVRCRDVVQLFRRNDANAVEQVDLGDSPALRVILSLPDAGSTLDEIVGQLLNFASSTTSLHAYLAQLIEEGLLVRADSPSVATADELGSANAQLRKLGVPARIASGERLFRLDERLVELGEQVDACFAEVAPSASLHPSRAAIYDLWKDVAAGRIGTDLLDEAVDITQVLEHFSYGEEDTRLSQLRAFLLQRYEGREVPLCEALDPDSGFDFPASRVPTVMPSQLFDWLLRKFANAISSGTDVVLERDDLPTRGAASPVPSALSLMCSVQLTSEGPVLFNPTITSGSPATHLFARASAFSEQTREGLQEFLAAQARTMPDSDLAALTYFVPGASAALLQFPNEAPYEVTLAARPGAIESKRIDVNDLCIRVQANKIRLRSQRSGRDVVVVSLGAAVLDRPDTPSLIRFLACHAPSTRCEFEWGAIGAAPFLPRVRFGRHVLAVARWNLGKSDIARLVESASTPERWELVQNLRALHRWPRHLLFCEANEQFLPVDLDDVLSTEAWLDTIDKNTTRIELREQVNHDDSLVVGPEGCYHHEVVLPFVRSPAASAKPEPALPYSARDTFDRVPPGDRCLYVELRGSIREIMPTTLIGAVAKLAHVGLDTGDLTHWFYLPYSDPEPHLRLRFFGAPEYLFGVLLMRLRRALDAEFSRRTIRTIDVRTYHRETVRYGGGLGMDICEQVFFYSSEATLQQHEAHLDSQDAATPITALAVSLLAFLNCTGLNASAQQALVVGAAAKYDLAPDPHRARNAASGLLRSRRLSFSSPVDSESCLGATNAAGLRRNFLALQRVHEDGALGRPLESILMDLLHVHSLRILTTWPSLVNAEAIAYRLVEKTLATSAARARNAIHDT